MVVQVEFNLCHDIYVISKLKVDVLSYELLSMALLYIPFFIFGVESN